MRSLIFLILLVLLCAVVHTGSAAETYAFCKAWGNNGVGNGDFDNPNGIAVDSAGNVYVADTDNHRIQKFDANGTIIMKWGVFGDGDGQLRWPQDVAVDSVGNVFVADTGNDRIQKFSSTGTFITKWGTPDYEDGNHPWVIVDGSMAYRTTLDGELDYPISVAVDSTGAVYVTEGTLWPDYIVEIGALYDYRYASGSRVHKFTSDGTFITKWGSPGFGNGQFDNPCGIAVDDAGNVYVVDYWARVQKFTSSGSFITTWDSYGTGDGQFDYPSGVAVDSTGNVYITDCWINRVQKFTSSGTFITKWGTFGSDEGNFSSPQGLVVAPSGEVYVADTKNNRVQKFRQPYPVVLVHGWIADSSMWDDMEPALKEKGIPVWNFDYEPFNTYDPTAVATRLDAYIEQKRHDQDQYPRDKYPDGYTGKIDIVCHSMGAVVSRWYMEQLDGGTHRNEVHQWIGIAPAHGGSALADKWDVSPAWLQRIILRKLGEAVVHLRTTSPTIAALRAGPPHDSLVKYRVIAGWNPHLSFSFGWGWGLTYTTIAKNPYAVGSTDPYYSTRNGDLIVATAQSWHPAMEFDCFPILGDPEGGNAEPFDSFDHSHLCHSPTVIKTVFKYLQNPEESSSNIVPPDDSLDIKYKSSEKTDTGIITGFESLQRFIDVTITRIIDGARVRSVSAGSSLNASLMIDLNWTEGDLSLELTSPDGERLTSSTNQPGVTYWQGPNRRTFVIGSPAEGNWSINITPQTSPGYPIGYNLTSTVVEFGPSDGFQILTPTPTPTPLLITIVSNGGTNSPTDPDTDGKYDDVNGNNRADFADVVLYFNQMTWIAANEPIAAFDYNGNGRIDFADVVWLFNNL